MLLRDHGVDRGAGKRGTALQTLLTAPERGDK
jgi:hypothetical protein